MLLHFHTRLTASGKRISRFAEQSISRTAGAYHSPIGEYHGAKCLRPRRNTGVLGIFGGFGANEGGDNAALHPLG